MAFRIRESDPETVQMVYLEQEMGQTTDPLVRRAFGNVYEVLLACNEAQRQQWLIPCVRGERTCSIAMTEPEAGSDSAGITATAKPDGHGWVLNAHKCPVGDGMFSDFYVVSARSENVEGSRGISLFLVDRSMCRKIHRMVSRVQTRRVRLCWQERKLELPGRTRRLRKFCSPRRMFCEP